MNSLWACGDYILEEIVPGTCQTEHNIVVPNLQQTLIDPRILPGKSIEVIIIKLRMFFELIVVVYASLVVLIKCTGKWNVRIQVYYGRLICL